MYYFDPDFGYVCVTGTAGDVVYGRGAVVPHDPTTLADQRYTHFAKWVEVEQHHLPDEWLIAFGKPNPKADEIVVTDGPSNWGWAAWTVYLPIVFVIYYTLYLLLI